MKKYEKEYLREFFKIMTEYNNYFSYFHPRADASSYTWGGKEITLLRKFEEKNQELLEMIIKKYHLKPKQILRIKDIKIDYTL